MSDSYQALFDSDLFQLFTEETREKFRQKCKYSRIKNMVIRLVLLFFPLFMIAAICRTLAMVGVIFHSVQTLDYCFKICSACAIAATLAYALIPHIRTGIDLDALRKILGYQTIDQLYRASSEDLFRTGRAAMKPYVEKIEALEHDKNLNLSEATKEFVERRLDFHRYMLKLDFDRIKAAGIFPPKMGYDSFFR